MIVLWLGWPNTLCPDFGWRSVLDKVGCLQSLGHSKWVWCEDSHFIMLLLHASHDVLQVLVLLLANGHKLFVFAFEQIAHHQRSTIAVIRRHWISQQIWCPPLLWWHWWWRCWCWHLAVSPLQVHCVICWGWVVHKMVVALPVPEDPSHILGHELSQAEACWEICGKTPLSIVLCVAVDRGSHLCQLVALIWKISHCVFIQRVEQNWPATENDVIVA